MNKKIFLLASLLVFAAGCSDDSDNTDAVCGNLAVENGEKCDDGNTVAGDGCAADCKSVEDGYTCPENGGACSKIEATDAVCGNEIVEDGEKCDDGNTVAGDGCAADCKSVEDGYTCPKNGGKCSKKEGSVAVCGNGHLEDGEECDDGNMISGDGCAADCKSIEEGYECPDEGVACEKLPACGDGNLDDGEECDDGNTVAGDGCAADCKSVEEGFHCDEPGQLCAADTCGDEKVDAGEDCDNGIMNTDYGIEGDCSESCHPAHFCGDAKRDQIDIDNGEECDDGKENNTGGYGKCKNDCKLDAFCGDGRLQPEYEQCDDGNNTDGDGCAANCKIESGFSCTTQDGKSVCGSILCGNGKIDENTAELCDDGNRESGDGCSMICQPERGFHCTTDENGKSVCKKTCGDGKLDADAGEQCDDNNLIDGDGCSSQCIIEPGYICNENGCFARACGDGILAGTEECDDGNTVDGDGCSFRCRVEKGWLCDANGKNCNQGRCGDGIVQIGEQCDNDIVAQGKPAAGDGCSETCTIEPGFECKITGGECKPVTCGDGSIKPTNGFISYEQCDLGDGNNDGTKGCSNICTIVDGYHCDDNGKNCAPGTCGNGILDAGEQCDDGNFKPSDGCSPDCKLETGIECSHGVCKPVCGDGVTMWMLDPSIAEECDDGNLINGDGCSSDCKIETGFTCTEFSESNLPTLISLPVTYRDFRSYGRDTVEQAGTTDGFITQELIDRYPDAHWNQSHINLPLRDFDSQSACSKKGYVHDTLDEDGKPVLVDDGVGQCFFSRAAFAMWYRNTPGLNKEVEHKLYLWRQGTSKSYYFTSKAPTTHDAPNVCVDGQPLEPDFFLPLATAGYGITGGNGNFVTRHANYSFTSEVSTFFQYKGGETLKFSGDDDLWVFFNGKLFVDLGGLHGEISNEGKLAKDTCEFTDENGNKTTVICDKKYNVYQGGIYEMKLFHAERNATGSNFSLTLTNFLNSGKASCSAICGDGIVRGNEECDYVGIDKIVELQHEKGCSADCKLQPYCGNGKIEAGEQCDSTAEWCVNCKIAGDTCGNGVKDAHEECDGTDGIGEGQVCLPTCRISGCGDGYVDEKNGEQCDDGNKSDDDMCTSKCTEPKCGDGVVTPFLGEVCDDGINDGAYGHCGFGCAYWAPRCGDGVVDANYEQCDDGAENNTGGYGKCNPDCTFDIRCGDGIVQPEFEQCDDPNNASCSKSCTWIIN